MSDKKTELKGKSWKREREERGRRQGSHRAYGLNSSENENPDKKRPDCSDQKTNSSSSDHNFKKSKEDLTAVKGDENVQNGNVQLQNTGTEVLLTDEVENNNEAAAIEEEKQELEQYISEIREKLKQKGELRHLNGNADAYRPEETFFTKLDSSLKKNTAFIKRLRNMTDAQKDSLIKDMESLNLTKYISEAASAIVDAKLKMSDVNTAVQICSLLHQRYVDFSSQLLEHWQKVFPMKKR